jgi:hypothetical protein
MKSAYELAMERLNQSSPTIKLTDEQKRELADLESQCVAKIADRELFLKGQIVKAAEQGDFETVERLEQQLVNDRRALRQEFDEKKDKVRAAKK